MGKRVKKINRKWWILFLLSFIMFILLLSSGKRGFIEQVRTYYKKTRLKNEIAELNKVKEELKEGEKELDDPETIEKIAREEYGMAKPNEKVYHVVPQEKK